MPIKPFTLYNPVRIHFGEGMLEKLDQEIPQEARVLLTFGGGSVKSTGLYDRVIAQLGKRHVVPFGGIEPNPHFETLLKALPLIREEKLDFILAVGGGSVIDGSKFIAAAALYPHEDPWYILRPKEKAHIVTQALPLGTVLTISATGSEMNNGGVITRAATQEKYGFHTEACFPRFSIVDPTITLTLPPHQVANGVVDAFIHVTEQYLTYPTNAMVQDGFAEALLRTLLEIGPILKENPQNIEARANLSMAAMVALNGWIATGVPEDWATHRIGHELTALFGLDHAVTLAIVLPHLLRDQLEGKRGKLAQCAKRVFNCQAQDETEQAEYCIERIEHFLNTMLPHCTLRELGIPRGRVLTIPNRLEARGWALGERRTVDHIATRRILEAALAK